MITQRVASRLYFAYLGTTNAVRPIDKRVASAIFKGGAEITHCFGVGNTPFHVEITVRDIVEAAGDRPNYNASNNSVQQAHDAEAIAALGQALDSL